MGYAERNNRIENGAPHPPDPAAHVQWCARERIAEAECTCAQMPALRCTSCQHVLEPQANERPHRYAERVRAHALSHTSPPGFEQGRVVRTVRPPASPEGTES